MKISMSGLNSQNYDCIKMFVFFKV